MAKRSPAPGRRSREDALPCPGAEQQQGPPRRNLPGSRRTRRAPTDGSIVRGAPPPRDPCGQRVPSVIRGSAIEVAWTATHIVTYPLGVARGAGASSGGAPHPRRPAPVQRGLIIGDVETPAPRSSSSTESSTTRPIFARVMRGPEPARVRPDHHAELLAVDRRRPVVAAPPEDPRRDGAHETGYERVHVIGHSMGGLVARYYVQWIGGDPACTPSSRLAPRTQARCPPTSFPHSVVRQMRPDQPHRPRARRPLTGLPDPDCGHLVGPRPDDHPQTNARIVHPDLNARNVFVPGVGHMSFPVDGRVVHEICTTLAQLDTDGSTVVEGATSIGSAPSRQGPRRHPPALTRDAPMVRQAVAAPFSRRR